MKIFVYQQLQIFPPRLHRRTLLATRVALCVRSGCTGRSWTPVSGSLCAAGSSLWTVGLRSVRLYERSLEECHSYDDIRLYNTSICNNRRFCPSPVKASLMYHYTRKTSNTRRTKHKP